MEKKYYTPDLEDLHLGYEFEIKNDEGEWVPNGLYLSPLSSRGEDYNLILIAEKEIRTPYLSKEDIESLGFILKHKSVDYWFEYNKQLLLSPEFNKFHGGTAYRIFLNYGFHDNRLSIKADFEGNGNYDSSEFLFEGECKSINELKKILKWLKIK